MTGLRWGGGLLAALLLGCAGSSSAPEAGRGVVRVPEVRALADLRALAADSMEGRRTGTPGAERARRYLLRAFREAGLAAYGGSFERPFVFERSGERIEGVNLVGYVEGRAAGGPLIVVTAHYDHVGVRDGQIYNGADDNASGVAALLALARHFAQATPEHDIVFAALDAEEIGLRGARAFLDDPPVARERIALNVNMDMVSRSERGELFAAGTHHSPFLRPYLEGVAARAPVRLRFGHDSPDLPRSDDWTLQSDHGAFHAAGIPFVYFGVEDHPDYHRPSDDAERIDPGFFAGAVETVTAGVEVLDEHLGEIDAARSRGSTSP